MKKWALALLMTILTAPLFAWQFGSFDAQSSDRLVVLDPDEWSQKQLYEIREQGFTPIAWLNVGEIEDWRLLVHEFRSIEEYALLKRRSENGLMLARFYSAAFRQIVETRLKSYIHKGFAGVFFVKAGLYGKVSNSPINRSEMWLLLDRLSTLAFTITAKPVLLIEGSEFYEEVLADKKFAGIVLSELFRNRHRKRVYAWQRRQRVDMVKKMRSAGKMVLTAEMNGSEKQREQIMLDCKKLGINCCFADLPLRMKRRDKIDYKK